MKCQLGTKKDYVLEQRRKIAEQSKKDKAEQKARLEREWKDKRRN